MKSYPVKFTTMVATAATFIIMFMVVASISPIPSAAQTQPVDEATNALPRTITVIGEGAVRTEPDVAEANIGVQVTRPTVEEATAETQGIMDAVLAALQAQGIAEADVQTSGFNVFVEAQPFEMQESSASADRYQVSNNVHVTIRDLEQVSTVLDAVIEAGANRIFGVNFVVSETEQQESEARAQAMTNAQAQAQELADLAGVELGPVISVSEVIGNTGMPFGANVSAISYAGQGGGGPISPGELEVRSQLQVVYGHN